MPAGDPTPFRDAEAWLAERGIEREPLRVAPDARPGTERADQRDATPSHGPVTAREAGRLAAQAAADAALRQGDADALPDPEAGGLEDDVADALAFVRRSTAMAPQSESRVADKLAERGWGRPVIDRTLARARRERLIDDAAMVAALVEERRVKGHAPARIRRDLQERGFEADLVAEALAPAAAEDPEAAAFAVAATKAATLTGLEAETAFRRVVGHVTRRGFPDGVARKVAREAVFTAREAERTAGH